MQIFDPAKEPFLRIQAAWACCPICTMQNESQIGICPGHESCAEISHHLRAAYAAVSER